MIRVDYHLHPNIPRWGRGAWMRRWWQAIEANRLDAIVVTEHSYRDPQAAYDLMLMYQPPGSKTHVFAGIEVLTAEGLEIIVFAKDRSVYTYEALMRPWHSSVETILELLHAHKGLVGIVPHPCTPGTTSMVRKKGFSSAKSIIDRLGSVELHNGSMLGVMRLLEKTRLHKLFSAKYLQAKQTVLLPKDLYPKRPRLLVAGSDAHRPDCLGACVEITGNASTRDAVFGCISKSRGKVIMQSRSSVIKDMGVVCKEWLLKQII